MTVRINADQIQMPGLQRANEIGRGGSLPTFVRPPLLDPLGRGCQGSAFYPPALVTPCGQSFGNQTIPLGLEHFLRHHSPSSRTRRNSAAPNPEMNCTLPPLHDHQSTSTDATTGSASVRHRECGSERLDEPRHRLPYVNA